MLHGRVIHEDLIDFARRYLLAAAHDDFLEPARDAHITFFVLRTLVAGAEPAIGEGFAVGLGIVFIARSHVRAADHDLAGFAGGKQIAFIVHDCHVGTGGQADRAGDAFARRQRVACHLVRRLGHAIGFDQRRTEHLLQFGDHLRRH